MEAGFSTFCPACFLRSQQREVFSLLFLSDGVSTMSIIAHRHIASVRALSSVLRHMSIGSMRLQAARPLSDASWWVPARIQILLVLQIAERQENSWPSFSTLRNFQIYTDKRVSFYSIFSARTARRNSQRNFAVKAVHAKESFYPPSRASHLRLSAGMLFGIPVLQHGGIPMENVQENPASRRSFSPGVESKHPRLLAPARRRRYQATYYRPASAVFACGATGLHHPCPWGRRAESETCSRHIRLRRPGM